MAKILLADDSAHAQRMGARILSAEGHQVTTVSNGQAAIKMLSELTPDLIVADVFMPGKTGYEVCEFVKSDSKYDWIPVLLLVGKMEPYDPVEGQRVRANAVVTKPLESSDLVAVVQTLLAAVKRPPPPPPPTAKVERPATEPRPQPEASIEDEITTPITTPVQLEIPEEIRQQPVSMVGELLEPPVAPPAAAEIKGPTTELTSPEAAPVEAASREQPDTVPVQETESAQIEQPLAAVPGASEREPSADSEIPIQEFAPAPPPSWTAEPAAVTEDDKKLFEPPPPDWQGLVSMVEEEGEHEQFPAVATAGMERTGSQPDAESATALSAASVAAAETEFPSAGTLLRPEGNLDSEAAERKVLSSPAIAKAVSPTDSVDLPAPAIAPLDYATVEQIVRETVEELMPQIMDRIAQVTGIPFARKG